MLRGGQDNRMLRRPTENAMAGRPSQNTMLSRLGQNTMRAPAVEQRSFERVTDLQKSIAAIRGTKELGKLPEYLRARLYDLDFKKPQDRLLAMGRTLDQDIKASASELIRDENDELLFFHKPKGVLYRIDPKDPSFRWFFARYIASGPSEKAADAPFTYLVESMSADAAEKPRTQIHDLAYYDSSTGLIAVSDGGGRVWKRERGGPWKEQLNGEGGLLFYTSEHSNFWKPNIPDVVYETEDWDRPANAFDGWLRRIPFDPSATLPPDRQRTALKIFILSLLFPSLRHTKPIPCFLGRSDATKSTVCRMIGRLLEGTQDWDTMKVVEKGEDILDLSLINHLVCGIDNADSPVSWLEQVLNVFSTGQRIPRRILYTTATLRDFKPRAVLLINSHSPHFKASDVSKRLLEFDLVKPEMFIPEPEFWQDFELRRGDIWGTMLAYAGKIADALAEVSLPRSNFRMADYASFGAVAMLAMGREDEWQSILDQLSQRQVQFSAEGNQIVECFDAVLQERLEESPWEIGMTKLFEACKAKSANPSNFFKTSHAFSQAFRRDLDIVTRTLKVQVELTKRKGYATEVRVTRLPAVEKGSGGG